MKFALTPKVGVSAISRKTTTKVAATGHHHDTAPARARNFVAAKVERLSLDLAAAGAVDPVRTLDCDRRLRWTDYHWVVTSENQGLIMVDNGWYIYGSIRWAFFLWVDWHFGKIKNGNPNGLELNPKKLRHKRRFSRAQRHVFQGWSTMCAPPVIRWFVNPINCIKNHSS